jgi:hypothetical protein
MNASAGAENIRIMAVFECRHQTETVESFSLLSVSPCWEKIQQVWAGDVVSSVIFWGGLVRVPGFATRVQYAVGILWRMGHP